MARRGQPDAADRRGRRRAPHVLVGVTGGVAAYKAVELCRLLQRMGIEVSVIQTRSSLEFVGTATFAALTGRPVLIDMWGAAHGASPASAAASEDDAELQAASVFPHIDAARQADALVVAPATANTLARFATGIADDVLSTTYLAFDGPVVIAPAMNMHMLAHPATRRNLAQLVADGVTIVEPQSGLLACGDEGPGRLAEVDVIAAEVARVLAPRDLAGRVVLVTAGGTREPIDDVRAITNRSSGRMGSALARAARDRGATVRLIVTNSVDRSLFAGIEPVATVEGAAELEATIDREAPACDIVLMAAAVSDFTVERAAGKLPRDAATALELVPTSDIIGTLGARRAQSADPSHPVLVAFAADAGEAGLERARGKLEAKQVDMVVFNDVSIAGRGFDTADNAVTIIDRAGELEVGLRSKRLVADAVLDRVLELRPGVRTAG